MLPAGTVALLPSEGEVYIAVKGEPFNRPAIHNRPDGSQCGYMPIGADGSLVCTKCGWTGHTVPPPVLADLVQKKCETCHPEPHPSGECRCVPCNSPAYGHPAHPHCAACCAGTLIESYAHDCPVGDHAEWAQRQHPTSDCPACAGTGSDLIELMQECPDCLSDHPGWMLSGGNEKKLPDGRWVWLCNCRDQESPFDKAFGVVSLGRWKVDGLWPIVAFPKLDDWPKYDCVVIDPEGDEPPFIYTHGDGMTMTITVTGTPEPGGYVATLTLMVAP